jgi:hypothetical protein
MSEPEGSLFSFVFNRGEAIKVFKKVGLRDFVLGVLATVKAKPEWEGCLVFMGVSPMDPDATACLATEGPGASEAQLAILEGFERMGVLPLAVFEGGPEPADELARVTDGAWGEP